MNKKTFKIAKEISYRQFLTVKGFGEKQWYVLGRVLVA